MTSLTLDNNQARYQIRAYRPGLIQINEQFFHHSLIISADQLIPWAPGTVADLTPEDFQKIADLRPLVLLLGTGAKHALLKPHLYGGLINLGIGVEVMSTGAACRTFNALTSENRQVAAALLIR